MSSPLDPASLDFHSVHMTSEIRVSPFLNKTKKPNKIRTAVRAGGVRTYIGLARVPTNTKKTSHTYCQSDRDVEAHKTKLEYTDY